MILSSIRLAVIVLRSKCNYDESCHAKCRCKITKLTITALRITFNPKMLNVIHYAECRRTNNRGTFETGGMTVGSNYDIFRRL